MITYGLVKQIGPYAINYPQGFSRNNTTTIAPKYEYKNMLGTVVYDRSEWAGRIVQDKDYFIANEQNLGKERAIFKKKQALTRLKALIENRLGSNQDDKSIKEKEEMEKILEDIEMYSSERGYQWRGDASQAQYNAALKYASKWVNQQKDLRKQAQEKAILEQQTAASTMSSVARGIETDELEELREMFEDLNPRSEYSYTKDGPGMVFEKTSSDVDL
jgi:hypothetical protein